MNLTAITDAEGIESKHFIDSLLLAGCPEVRGKMVDVGTGAGFPGIVTKLYKPEMELTLLEPTGKRVDFLRYACAQLGIEAEFAKERAEEAARKRWREAFDVATARAVAALPVLAEYCLPLVRVGGMFIAIFTGWKLDRSVVRDELTGGGRLYVPFFNSFIFILKYVAPVAIASIFVNEILK